MTFIEALLYAKYCAKHFFKRLIIITCTSQGFREGQIRKQYEWSGAY